MKRIINIYIFKEMIPNFTTSLIVFTFLVLAGKILMLTEWMVNHGTRLSQVLLITVYTIPRVLFYTLPMATLLASLIAISRLNEDNEIIALRSSGVSLCQIIPPVATFSIISYLFASFIAIYLIPASNYSMAKVLFEVARSSTSIGIKQGIFNDSIPNVMLYANYISVHDQTMKEVFVFDERDPTLSNTIIARQGRISSNPEQMSLNLHLTDGSAYAVGKNLDSPRVMKFKTYDLKIDHFDTGNRPSSLKKGRREMSISELRHHLKETKKGTRRHNKATMELHRKFSAPFACLILGLIGLPLGLMKRAKGRSWGIALSVAVFMLYYSLLVVSTSIGKPGKLNPVLAVWIPNMVLGATALVLLWRAGRDT